MTLFIVVTIWLFLLLIFNIRSVFSSIDNLNPNSLKNQNDSISTEISMKIEPINLFIQLLQPGKCFSNWLEEIEERQKKIPQITQQMKEEYDAIPQEEIERKNDKLAEQLSFAIFNQIDKINKENLLTADRDICNQKKKNNNDACTNIFFDEKTKICIVSRLETKTCKAENRANKKKRFSIFNYE